METILPDIFGPGGMLYTMDDSIEVDISQIENLISIVDSEGNLIFCIDKEGNADVLDQAKLTEWAKTIYDILQDRNMQRDAEETE